MKRSRVFFPLLFCLSLAGCMPQRPADLPELYPCTIRILSDGAPLEGATVTLQYAPDDFPPDGQRWFPVGVTDPNGTAVIRANGRYGGAPLGRFKVTVSKFEKEPSKLGPAPLENDPAYLQWQNRLEKEPNIEYGLIDKRYLDGSQTPFTVEISKGKNEAQFDVGAFVRYRMPQ